MSWARKAAKAVGMMAGGLFGVVALAYLLLVAINWKDRPPSPTVARFEAFYANRPSVPAAENAYTFMLGFTDRSYKADRPDDVAELTMACGAFEERCADALESPGAPTSRWLESEEPLLDRYLRLISLTGYREPRHDVAAPLPSYSRLLEGQRLLFLRAWVAAESGDVDLVEKSLDDDLAFWRNVLANADVVLSKMIAVAATTRSFEMGNLLSRHLQQNGVHLRLPASWSAKLSDEERSMERCLIGEWFYGESYLKETELASRGRLAWMLFSPFWQRQYTSNRRADLVARIIALSEVPYERLPESHLRTANVPPVASGTVDRLYNLAGRVFVADLSSVDWRAYVVRVADLEGIRRAAVTAWQLRNAAVKPADVQSTLLGFDESNPYSGEPFDWDASANAIVFVGLGPRPRHALPY